MKRNSSYLLAFQRENHWCEILTYRIGNPPWSMRRTGVNGVKRESRVVD